MKKIIVICAALALVSCGGGKQNGMTWRMAEVKHDSLCNMTVNLSYPVFEGGDSAVSSRINRFIDSVVVSGMEITTPYKPGTSVQGQVELSYAEKCSDSMISHMYMDFAMKSSVYEIGNIFSVYIAKMYFPGGAHPNDMYYYFNFSKETGAIVPNEEFFTDKAKLLKLTRLAFYAKRGIKPSQTQEDAMMFVEPSELPLPENIGFDSAGVAMIYNNYEVGPRSFGLTPLSLPMSDVSDILSDVVK